MRALGPKSWWRRVVLSPGEVETQQPALEKEKAGRKAPPVASANDVASQKLSPEELQRKQEKRQRNIVHSRIKRQRKKLEVEVLRKQCAQYVVQNINLYRENERLEQLLELGTRVVQDHEQQEAVSMMGLHHMQVTPGATNWIPTEMMRALQLELIRHEQPQPRQGPSAAAFPLVDQQTHEQLKELKIQLILRHLLTSTPSFQQGVEGQGQPQQEGSARRVTEDEAEYRDQKPPAR